MRQHTPNRSRWWKAMALTSSLALVAAACGDDSDDDTTTDDEPTETTEDEEAAPVDNCPTDDAIQIGWIPWDEDIAVTWLWDALLTEQGHEVEQTQLEVGPLYTGLANGDLDLFLDAWLPETHGSYWDDYGDQIEDLGVWNDSATLHLTVPEYTGITSIEELADNADDFGNQIVGIEAGAGIMEATGERAMADYELEDDFELVESSTPAMLTELDSAVEAEEPIVVTLWHPHWAYDAYDLVDLEDPEGSMGEGENINVVACEGFTEANPEIAEWMNNFELTSEELNGLTNLVIEEYEDGQEAEAIEEWLSDDENRALADSWIDGDGEAPADDADAEDDADADADADAEAETDADDDAEADGGDADDEE